MRHNFTVTTKRQKLVAGGIALILLAIALYVYMGMGKDSMQKVRRNRPVVEVQEVVRADMGRHIVLSGQTVADASISLAPKYNGRITAVYVELGDWVEEGQVLMVQDLEDLDISIAQNAAAAGAARADVRETAANYNANLSSKKNAYELASAKYERQKYLFSIGAISQDKLDSVEAEYSAAKAAYEVLANQQAGGMAAAIESKELLAAKQEHATEALEKQRSDMILRAPRSGIIAYRNAEVGAMAAAGTKAFTLVDNGHINVDCTIGENDAAILQAGMEVNYTPPEQDPPMIPGDPERLKQVFLNLLDNAATHGGEGKKVDVGLTTEPDGVHITVRDYGHGIPEAELPHVKEKFYKGSSKNRGNGIGLAVCDEIATRHRGRLDVVNAPGGGCIVTLVLPLK